MKLNNLSQQVSSFVQNTYTKLELPSALAFGVRICGSNYRSYTAIRHLNNL